MCLYTYMYVHVHIYLYLYLCLCLYLYVYTQMYTLRIHVIHVRRQVTDNPLPTHYVHTSLGTYITRTCHVIVY